MTTQEAIDAVEAAIGRVLDSGQSYSVDTPDGSRTVTRANLAEMRRYRKELEAKLDREQRGGIRTQRSVPGGF